ncbi:MAG: hypothetical protein M3Q07_25480, partial [Pseudobdellovibrionaceae bacterium]|nr:hypothetical protein [Pseudobdellovibrionaceae bacterium]
SLTGAATAHGTPLTIAVKLQALTCADGLLHWKLVALTLTVRGKTLSDRHCGKILQIAWSGELKKIPFLLNTTIPVMDNFNRSGSLVLT